MPAELDVATDVVVATEVDVVDVVPSAATLSHAAASVRVVMSTTATDRTNCLRMRTFEGLEQRVPSERRALDAHRKLDDTLKSFEVTEVHRRVDGCVAFFD